ncbi:MAG: MBL fold metallo-hydrolase [Cyanobacteria bacterium SZAS LIN-2]|nr:MBL fold metallo-hydrolase [Cyanobacteria bacterium SZAS LIN-3]MBS1997149.1 MBL fold metallo-hydrolase [Cyanobacteria bacterium SZAS LIN-2]
MKFGDFELSIVRESTLSLDGGAMFGVVPKTLWEKSSPADELNRVKMHCNLLLIDTGSAKVLVETGMGDRWSAAERERYGLETHVAPEDAVRELGLSPEQIDFVIISHLHFDHAGGAVRLLDGKLVPTYPRARYIVQAGEWDFAFKANARARASYRPDDFVPLKESGQLQLVEGNTEITPGVFVRVTGGHTSHHQVVYFESGAEKGVFFADIMPTRSHLNPPWVMGYDHFPLTSCDVKSEYLAQAAEQNWLVVFDHEYGIPWGHIVKGEGPKGKFEFRPLPAQSLISTAQIC